MPQNLLQNMGRLEDNGVECTMSILREGRKTRGYEKREGRGEGKEFLPLTLSSVTAAILLHFSLEYRPLRNSWFPSICSSGMTDFLP